jgi:sulfur carrier protein
MSDVMGAATIEVNGRREPLSAATLAALLQDRGVEPGARGLAVALNGAVVPRTHWPQTPLRGGDAVEIVRAMQGG